MDNDDVVEMLWIAYQPNELNNTQIIIDITRDNVYVPQPVDEYSVGVGVSDLNVEPSSWNEFGFDIATTTSAFDTLQVSLLETTKYSNGGWRPVQPKC